MEAEDLGEGTALVLKEPSPTVTSPLKDVAGHCTCDREMRGLDADAG